MDYEPWHCLMPERCAPARVCKWEQTRLRRGDDLGDQAAPLCFIALLRSLYDVETVRRTLTERAFRDA